MNDQRPRHLSRSRPARWPWLLVVIAIAAAGAWMLRPQPVPQAPSDAAPDVPQAGPAGAVDGASALPVAPLAEAPGIQHPVAPVEAADAAIPALADSDAALFEALGALAGEPSVLDVLLREHLVQRLVVMVDNLDQPRVTARALALQPLPGTFATTDADDGSQDIDPAANAGRYAPYVAAFTAADAVRMAATYRRFYPLFQQAYEELGRPQAYFNDRLVQVIDHLLQAPEPAGALTVAPDSRGRLRFVDPALESMSVGHKALVRLSPEQRGAVKQQLRALRAALART